MATRVAVIAAFLRDHHDTAWCSACLAGGVGMNPKAVSHLSMLLEGWRGMRRTTGACAVCGRDRLILRFTRTREDHALRVAPPTP